MSATLGCLGERLTSLLDCPLVHSAGRSYPVDVFHTGSMGENTRTEALRNHDLEYAIAQAVCEATEQHEGDILVFLPGEFEIMYTWALLNNDGIGDGKVPDNMSWQARELIDSGAADLSRCIQVCPLYGSLSREQQDEVLTPKDGWRKVYLSTPIAESSLTVPGVTVVIDSGLRRIVFTDSRTGIDFMRTIPISTASADQRKGRAGRVSPGVCYRLWSQAEHDGLRSNDIPELQAEDLSRCILDLAVAGYTSESAIAELPWVDSPEGPKIKDARAFLSRVKAIELESEDSWKLTCRGQELGKFPLHPRLGHMIIQASKVSPECLQDACDLAALLSEKDVLAGGGRKKYGSDIEVRLRALRDEQKTVAVRRDVKARILRTSKQLMDAITFEQTRSSTLSWKDDGAPTAVLLAWAYPELVASKADPRDRRRMRQVERGTSFYTMHVGCQGRLFNRDALGKHKYIAVAKVSDDKIWWAAAAEADVLVKYGISIEQPLTHEIFGMQDS
eukprot:TRINITY_DN38943_c0_g1_i1.p1 TRINITY_DN38943_c0_g1~~TRINITY_DN38943_c0_g1_i1.p1  ORF type:complete len:504 (+),score=58.58 TRINITY_DN38943_c0_g1_i1:740-2251(+)